MGPEHSLPLPAAYTDEESYVSDLLAFVTSSALWQLLVGGVHILDFFTSTPDLYERILDHEWRAWFDLHDIDDLMEFFLRDDVDSLLNEEAETWRGKQKPPRSLLEYISAIRKLTLCRDFSPDGSYECMSRRLAVGMKVKKIHEVDHFARYVQRLTSDVAATKRRKISHLVDFGAGQGYLGRFLASQPNNRHVIAVESRPHNVKLAKTMDIQAAIAPKQGIRRNKKQFRADQAAAAEESGEKMPKTYKMKDWPIDELDKSGIGDGEVVRAKLDLSIDGAGSVQHVERRLEDGDLTDVIHGLVDDPVEPPQSSGPNEQVDAAKSHLMVMSLHSCGNLTHHALRSLVVNPAVTAIAVVGCCYNLVTERLSPPSYKMDSLRPISQATSLAPGAEGDPRGFPMSSRLCEYPTAEGKGIRINITARMMAVQAPSNWGPDGSRAFFTRHFFRALLQRIFLDQGVIDPPIDESHGTQGGQYVGGRSPAGGGGSTQPIIIGSLGRRCYRDFVSYVRAAMTKLEEYQQRSPEFISRMNAVSDGEIRRYGEEYGGRKKELSVVWTLMAFSAMLVEAVIVVDRWLWLREQGEVEHCWVEPVFDYGQSPRNLVVVGIKR